MFHTARKLNKDYLSERQPNCETRRRQCETEPPVEETTSQLEPQLQNTDVGPSHQDEASAATSTESTTRTIGAFTNINKKQKTTPQIWRTYTHKLA